MRAVLLLVGAVVLSPSIAGAQPATKVRYAVCQSEGYQPTVYLSGAFSFPDGTKYQAYADAFKKTLTDKYKYEGSVTCNDFLTQAGADAAFAHSLTTLSRSRKVVQTKWNYSGAIPATSAPAGAPSATPASNPASADPRLATLSPEDRAIALGELPVSRGYCENNLTLSAMFDCDQFARAVLNYRIIHAKEKYPSEDRSGRMGWEPLINVIANDRFDCSICLVDAKTRVWADSVSRRYLSSLIAEQRITEAGVKAFAECFAREFTTRFRAKPAVNRYKEVYAETSDACLKQRSP